MIGVDNVLFLYVFNENVLFILRNNGFFYLFYFYVLLVCYLIIIFFLKVPNRGWLGEFRTFDS